MLPKLQRFTKQDFLGKRPKVFFRSDLFDVAACTLPTTKYTCVIAKKTIRKAVDRNRVKRRFYSIIRNYSSSSSLSLVFYPKKSTPTTPYSHLKKEITQVFDTLQ